MKNLILVLIWVLLSCLTQAAGVLLTWDNNEDQVNGYLVKYGTSPNNLNLMVDVGNYNSVGIIGLTPGITYYFAVVAYNGYFSENSNIISHVANDTQNYMGIVNLTQEINNQGQRNISFTVTGPRDPGYFTNTPKIINIMYSNDLLIWNVLAQITNVTGNVIVEDNTAYLVDKRFYRLAYDR